jgi:hypothetical protein
MEKVLIIAFTFLTFMVNAQNSSDKNYYLSTNVLTPVSGLNLKSPIANVLTPIFSNMEYGFTINAGILKNYYNLETRLTIGQSNPYNFVPQIQFGYNYFLIAKIKSNENGFYIGGFLRYWDYINRYNSSNLQNITTNFTLGYMWKKSNIIFDLRLNQPITIFSFSNIEHTKPKFELNLSSMPYFLPIMPALSLNIGYKF